MFFLSIAHDYLLWHYTRALHELFHVWMNIYWFIFHFFSISDLIRTWFSPWKRIIEEREKKFNLEAWAGYVIIGLVSRFIGFTLRSIVITAGLISVSINTGLGFLVYLTWLVLPLIIVLLVGLGVTLLVTSTQV